MRYDTICQSCKTTAEISKPMAAPLPPCHTCGGQLRRKFSVTPVIFNAPGFYETDVRHFEKQVGKERAAKFYAQRDDVLKRAKAGRLTDYEKRLDALEAAHG